MKVVSQLLLTFLLNASWQIVLVVVFAAVCDWLLRGLASRYRHALWVVALFLSFALPALSCARLLKTYMSVSRPQAQVSAAPLGFTSTYSPELDSTDTSASRNPVAPTQLEGVGRTQMGAPFRVNRSMAEVLMLIYALLLLYRGGQLFRAWRRTRTIIQAACEFAFLEPVQTIIQTCQTAIGVNRVRFLCSTSVPVPITVGIVKQLIVLPERLLHEVDEEVLTSAIGHELVHVARRDYLVNLIYEFTYLPLSFHPAAALVRRRIKQTRELCCDELVAKKLLRPEVYARSLVRLIGSAPIARRLAANTTIGINESDILEVRIMSLLNRTKLTARRKRMLLIAAALLLATLCIAATSFALTFDIDRQEPSVTPSQRTDQKLERENQERARVELKQAVRELKEKIRVAPESQRADAEAKLREAQENLELHERTLQQYDQQKREADEKKLQELRETLTQMEKSQPANEARMKELRQELAKIEGQYTADAASVRAAKEKLEQASQSSGDRKARVIYRVEPEYPEDARAKKIEGTVLLGFTIDHDGLPQSIQIKRSLYPSLDQAAIEAVRKWRFEPALKGGQPVSMWVNVEVYFALDSRSKEELEKRAAEEREMLANKADGQMYETRRSKQDEERSQEERTRKQAELARGATLSMDRAIQIATSQVPGKVLACSLGRDGDKLFYHVVIISGDGDKTTTTYVWVGAIDGQILKTEKEEPRKENEESATEPGQRASINGGVLNGKATNLPLPVFPAIARQAHASGAVTVEVTIDENGNVSAAHAVSGHPLLQAAAVNAARQASFAPTRVNGEPVKVAGVLIYNFAAQ